MFNVFSKEGLSEKELFDRIVRGDEKALELVYQKYYKLIHKLITSNSGTEEEMMDIYQDALVLFWQKARSGNLVLTSKIGTYIYGICKNLWWKELDRKKRLVNSEKDEEEIVDPDREEREKVVQKCLDGLDESCRKILTFFYFDGLSMQQIADEMGLANTNTAKTQKYKCKKKLDDLIKRSYSRQDFF